MFRRRPTSSDSTDASEHSRRQAVADSAWSAQDRLRSGIGGAFRSLAGTLDRAFDRLSFPLQRRLAWPLEDRAAALGVSRRALSTTALVLAAAAAGVVGLLWAAPNGPHHAATGPGEASSEPVAAVHEQPEPPAPTLHGAAPVFKPAAGQAAYELDPAKAVVKSSPAEPTGDSKAEPTPSGESAASASSSSGSSRPSEIDGPPAGPAAIAVARDFAGAFVRYETGSSDAQVRSAFGDTATPALARALLKRPPRLPANVEVPKAEVLNIVPSPSHAGVYPVSVSLLRLGLTSELRLEMEQRKGDRWRVTNVLG